MKIWWVILLSVFLSGCFGTDDVSDDDKEKAQQAIDKATKVLMSANYEPEQVFAESDVDNDGGVSRALTPSSFKETLNSSRKILWDFKLA